MKREKESKHTGRKELNKTMYEKQWKEGNKRVRKKNRLCFALLLSFVSELTVALECLVSVWRPFY